MSIDDFRAEPPDVPAPTSTTTSSFELHTGINSNRATWCAVQAVDATGQHFGVLMETSADGGTCTGARSITCRSELGSLDPAKRLVSCAAPWVQVRNSSTLEVPAGILNITLIANAYDKSHLRSGYGVGTLLHLYDVSAQEDTATIPVTLR